MCSASPRWEPSIAAAKLQAYTGVKCIRWHGAWCRKDISDKAHRVSVKLRCNLGRQLTAEFRVSFNKPHDVRQILQSLAVRYVRVMVPSHVLTLSPSLSRSSNQ